MKLYPFNYQHFRNVLGSNWQDSIESSGYLYELYQVYEYKTTKLLAHSLRKNRNAKTTLVEKK